MGNNSPRFIEKSFVPTFGEEFSNIATPEFDSEIWTTELVDALIDKVENYGLDLNKAKNPFFDKNPTLRKGRVAFQMTLQEKDEFKKCRKDIIYFANKYVQLMTPEGIGHITLYSYQEQMLLNYKNGKNNVEIEHYKVINGGHDWPGTFGNMDINANTIIWNFVSQFDLNGRI